VQALNIEFSDGVQPVIQLSRNGGPGTSNQIPFLRDDGSDFYGPTGFISPEAAGLTGTVTVQPLSWDTVYHVLFNPGDNQFWATTDATQCDVAVTAGHVYLCDVQTPTNSGTQNGTTAAIPPSSFPRRTVRTSA